MQWASKLACPTTVEYFQATRALLHPCAGQAGLYMDGHSKIARNQIKHTMQSIKTHVLKLASQTEHYSSYPSAELCLIFQLASILNLIESRQNVLPSYNDKDTLILESERHSA
jgi:hypothetical protein